MHSEKIYNILYLILFHVNYHQSSLLCALDVFALLTFYIYAMYAMAQKLSNISVCSFTSSPPQSPWHKGVCWAFLCVCVWVTDAAAAAMPPPQIPCRSFSSTMRKLTPALYSTAYFPARRYIFLWFFIKYASTRARNDENNTLRDLIRHRIYVQSHHHDRTAPPSV